MTVGRKRAPQENKKRITYTETKMYAWRAVKNVHRATHVIDRTKTDRIEGRRNLKKKKKEIQENQKKIYVNQLHITKTKEKQEKT